jgi:hypothetical protein
MTWFDEFYRRWQLSRGTRLTAASRGFSQSWPKLLDAAGVTRAEDIATAVREAEGLEKAGHVALKRHRYRRYLIERISLPVEQEPWLIGRFGGISGEEMQAKSLAVVERFSKRAHPRVPELWESLCVSLTESFRAARGPRPFSWKQPVVLESILDAVFRLSGTDWPVGTLIRAASVEIGRDSKWLELHRRACESGLTLLFGEELTLRALGLVDGDASVELSGPVCLHFPDGSQHDFDGLTHPILSAADLERCSAISTTAERLLTIENRKTTFRQYAAANADGRTLIATTSFPTPAFRSFLAKLPPALPHFHFGDTDPSGWQILLKLREAAGRPVRPFRMKFRAASTPEPLTPHDAKLLERLLAEPLLADVKMELRAALAANDRGDFEQETLPPPGPDGWPFGGEMR